MIRWCAGCQKYMGETAPFENFSLTHGLCEKCVLEYKNKTYDFKKIKSIVAFYRKIFDEIHIMKEDIEDIIKEAKELNIQEEDLIFGLLQPILYEIGKRWECGLITPETEHKYSFIVLKILKTMASNSENFNLYADSKTPKIILAPIHTNVHFIGLYMLEYLLSCKKVPHKFIKKSLTNEQLFFFVEKYQPETLGLSLSMPQQLSYLPQMVSLLSTLPFSCKLLCGGYAINQGFIAENLEGVEYAHQIFDLPYLK